MDCGVRGQLEVWTTKDVLASQKSYRVHFRVGRMDLIEDGLVVGEMAVVDAMEVGVLDIGRGQQEDMIEVLHLVRMQRQERRMDLILVHCSELRV